MLDFYQHLPSHINPIALRIGFLAITWYSIMYLIGFLVVYGLVVFRIKKNEAGSLVISNFQFPISNKIPNLKNQKSKTLILGFLIFAFVGLLIGGRLGYALFYNFAYFWQHPLAFISPFDQGGNYVGISGMSYFGGVIGIILISLIFIKKRGIHPVKSGEAGAKQFNRVNFWQLADFIIPAIPAGYFFGRLGNFLNGELFGRATDKPWGMYFADGVLRHPSQLYEAFFEGLVLFAILWIWRNRAKFPGQLLLIYLFCYAFFRFFIEFFREPDPQIGLFFNFLTLGQVFSLGVMLLSAGIYIIRKK